MAQVYYICQIALICFLCEGFFAWQEVMSKRTLYGVCVFVTMEMKNLYDFMGFSTKSSKLSLHLQCGSPE